MWEKVGNKFLIALKIPAFPIFKAYIKKRYAIVRNVIQHNSQLYCITKSLNLQRIYFYTQIFFKIQKE